MIKILFILCAVIDEEWQKTQCMPRETCVDVAKDLGTATNTFFKPPCVSVFRCGGCCNEEGVSCLNTSTSYILKSVTVFYFEIHFFNFFNGSIQNFKIISHLWILFWNENLF